MGNSLLQSNLPNNSGNSIISAINKVRAMGPSDLVFKQMYQTMPEFRQLANSVRGKTPEQAFREAGLDFNQAKKFRW